MGESPVTFKGVRTVDTKRLAVVDAIVEKTQLERRYFEVSKGCTLIRTEVYSSNSDGDFIVDPLPEPLIASQALELKLFDNGGWLAMRTRYHTCGTESATGGECNVDSVELTTEPDPGIFSIDPSPGHKVRHFAQNSHFYTAEKVSLSDFNEDGTVKESSRHLVPESEEYRWAMILFLKWLRERWPFSLFVNHPILASLTVAAVVLGPVVAFLRYRRNSKGHAA